MLSGNFESHFPVKLLAKDLNYAVKAQPSPRNFKPEAQSRFHLPEGDPAWHSMHR